MANLRAAAAGIHGASEALRGTFNDSIDRRFVAPDNAVHAKNQATIAAGRQEIETQHFTPREHHARPPAADAPPVPPIKTAYGGPPVSGSQVEGGSRGAKLSSFLKKKMDLDGSEAAKRYQTGNNVH
ncbi:hypothetical protein N0V95_006837 [Ascochyta clinopodiicola]|nr:hypothetical protein N0V95_006837 [Ascochyta clinopodiicola]